MHSLDNYLEVLKALEERIEEMDVEMYGFTKKKGVEHKSKWNISQKEEWTDKESRLRCFSEISKSMIIKDIMVEAQKDEKTENQGDKSFIQRECICAILRI